MYIVMLEQRPPHKTFFDEKKERRNYSTGTVAIARVVGIPIPVP